MADTIRLKAQDGSDVAFVDEIIGAGAIKDVYFSPDRSYVVGFYRTKIDFNTAERLKSITEKYRAGIFNQVGGEYWKKLFCWPEKVVEHKGLTGVVMPSYRSNFFFEFGSSRDDFLKLKKKEKQGKWFASAKHRMKNLDPRELGDWRSYLTLLLKLARAVRRMHMAGLAHSDLSYKNVLIDPRGGDACIIDIDSLVVPGRYPPDVLGTPDFIAPEVMSTRGLKVTDPKRMLPRIETDRHALAVLMYLYLLYRHPLRGGKIHDSDDTRDEELAMGERALFVEHPTDRSNRPNIKHVEPVFLPWADTDKIPYTACGPYLKELFDKAFVLGLHKPTERPTADDWERALVKTMDLLQPCTNPSCGQKWYVFDNSTKPKCPFCFTPFRGSLPILNLYSNHGGGNFKPDNYRLMVYSNQYIYPWHANRKIFPNEKLTADETKAVAYFQFHQGEWWVCNQTLTGMKDGTTKELVPIGGRVKLTDGLQLLLSPEEGGRLAYVQMVQC